MVSDQQWIITKKNIFKPTRNKRPNNTRICCSLAEHWVDDVVRILDECFSFLSTFCVSS